jgi:hypothetical protein
MHAWEHKINVLNLRKVLMLLLRLIYLFIWATILQGCDEDNTPAVTATVLRKLDVEYQGAISDQDLGIPTDLMHANRLTRIDIELEYFYFANAVEAEYELSSRDFDPNIHKSLTIRSPHLKITDSEGNDHVLVIYLVPLKTQSMEQNYMPFLLLTTLDNISYNFITRSQSHSSFFLNTQNNHHWSSAVQGRDIIESHASTPTSLASNNWIGVVFEIPPFHIYSKNFRSFLPENQTTQPCLKKLNEFSCNLDHNQKYIREYTSYPLLQPLAPISVVNKNWFVHEFNHGDLKFHRSGEPLTDFKKLILENEVKQILSQSGVGVDIGWFGLPIAEREQIERLHYTQINLSMVINPRSVSANHKINVKQIQIYEYTNVDLTQPDYTKQHTATPTNLMDSLLQETNIMFEVDGGDNTLTPQ